jgi:hypothetical protein
MVYRSYGAFAPEVEIEHVVATAAAVPRRRDAARLADQALDVLLGEPDLAPPG